MEYGIGSIVFGNWKIVSLIGEGSYGKVYEIHREDFGLTYKAALKVISVPQNKSEVLSLKHEGMTDDETTEYFYSMVQDIVNEFALMFDLKGMTNIVGYEDHVVIKKEEGIGWDVLIRMELLTPLLEYVSEQDFAAQDVVNLGIDICKALELCKKRNIIHRDLKPENIFVSKNGDYKIGDFGIARTIEKTMSGLSKKGTYSYMAPEIYKGESYGYTVDIYSLGIVLYRFLNNNRIPFMPAAPAPIKYSDREIALSRRINGEEILCPFYHNEKLTEILLKACAYESKDRYVNPTEMREALEGVNLEEVDSSVIYPAGEEVESTSQAILQSTSQVISKEIAEEVEEATISMLDAEDNTVSMLDEEDNTVSMLDEEDNTVSMLDEEDNTVSMLDEEEATVSMLDKESATVSWFEEKIETVEQPTFNIGQSFEAEQKAKLQEKEAAKQPEDEEKKKKKSRLIIIGVAIFISIVVYAIYYNQTYVLKDLYAESMAVTMGEQATLSVTKYPYTSTTDVECSVISGEAYILAYWNGSDVIITAKNTDVPAGAEVASILISSANGVTEYVDITLENVLRSIEAEPVNMEIGDNTILDMVQTPSNHNTELYFEVVEGAEYISVEWDGETALVVAEPIEVPEGEETAIIRIYTETGVEELVEVTLENVAIKVASKTIVLELGENYQLEPSMTPADTAEERDFEYEIASGSGFSVSSAGLIKAVANSNDGVTRTGTVSITSDNGLEKTVTVEVRDSFDYTSSEDAREYTDSNGTWTVYTRVFTNEVEDCTGLTVTYTLTDNESYAGKTFKVVGMNSSGKWTKLGTFICGEIDETVTTELTFSATDIKEVAFIPLTSSSGSWNKKSGIVTGTYE